MLLLDDALRTATVAFPDPPRWRMRLGVSEDVPYCDVEREPASAVRANYVTMHVAIEANWSR